MHMYNSMYSYFNSCMYSYMYVYSYVYRYLYHWHYKVVARCRMLLLLVHDRMRAVRARACVRTYHQALHICQASVALIFYYSRYFCVFSTCVLLKLLSISV